MIMYGMRIFRDTAATIFKNKNGRFMHEAAILAW